MSANNGNGWGNPSLYKTRLCDFWADGRACKYGVRCWFAHGPRELRDVPHLDSNPLAKTLSSIEVVNMLQPASRDHKNAVQYVSGLMGDPDFFHRFTVPYLNAMALRSMTADQKGMPTKEFVPGFMPPSMQGTQTASAPPNMFKESTVRPPKAELSKDLSALSLGSSFETLPTSVNGPLRTSSSSGVSSASTSWIHDPDDSSVFEPIRECFDGYCNNYFV